MLLLGYIALWHHSAYIWTIFNAIKQGGCPIGPLFIAKFLISVTVVPLFLGHFAALILFSDPGPLWSAADWLLGIVILPVDTGLFGEEDATLRTAAERIAAHALPASACWTTSVLQHSLIWVILGVFVQEWVPSLADPVLCFRLGTVTCLIQELYLWSEDFLDEMVDRLLTKLLEDKYRIGWQLHNHGDAPNAAADVQRH